MWARLKGHSELHKKIQDEIVRNDTVVTLKAFMEEEIANAKRRELEKLISESSDEYDDENDSLEDSEDQFEGSDLKGSRPQMEEMSNESDSRLSYKNRMRMEQL